MQANATLKNDRQATTDQLRAFIKLVSLHGARILDAKLDNGFMYVCYSTKSENFFVQIKYDQYGNEANKRYFKSWDADGCEPVNEVNFYE